MDEWIDEWIDGWIDDEDDVDNDDDDENEDDMATTTKMSFKANKNSTEYDTSATNRPNS